MPPPVRLSRNITDFFRPFSQPRDNSIAQEALGGGLETEQGKQTRSGNAKRQLAHEASADFDRLDAKLKSGATSLIPLGQDLEDIARTPRSPDVVLPRSLVYTEGGGYDGAPSSSLTPLESNSLSPVDELEPTMNGRSSFYSTTSTKADHLRSFGEDSLASGSQRVVRNGEVVIANSDEDTDSQESFEDLDELLNLPKQGLEVPHVSLQPEITRTPYTLRSKSSTEKTKPGYNPRKGLSDTNKASLTVQTTTKTPRFSLQMLVAQTAADQAIEMAAQRAEDSLKTVNDDAARSLGIQKNLFGDGNEESLVRNIELGDGDEDRKNRLVRAVHRSQLLQREKTWSFFDMSGSDFGNSTVAFPDCSTQGKWATQLQVPALREQAFLSGFVAEVATRSRLPTKLLYWIIDALSAESSHVLRDAYVSTLVSAARQTSAMLSPKAIKQLFRRIGASEDAMDMDIPAKATVQPLAANGDSPTRSDWSKVLSVLELLRGIVAKIEKGRRTQTLLLICRLALDGTAMRHGKVMPALGDLFVDLLDSISPLDFEQELHELLIKVYPSVHDPQLQNLLLQSVPTSRSRVAIFRCRLALAWFFRDDSYLALKLDRLPLFPKIRKRLEDSDLKIHPGANFLHLGTSIMFLDIAVGDGAPPFTSAASGDIIKEFNKEVDRLAIILKGMAADINDTGSANLARAEAKDLLETFLSRLTYTIRTKPKPRNDIFESFTRVSKYNVKRSRGTMDNFLVRRPQDAELETIGDIEVPDNDSELLQYQWERDLAKAL